MDRVDKPRTARTGMSVQRADGSKWIAAVLLSAVAGYATARWTAPDFCPQADEIRTRPPRLREDVADADANGPAAAAVSATSTASSQPALRIEVPADAGGVGKQLVQQNARIAELEAKVSRLQQALDGQDPQRRLITALIDANELQHAALYRELAELFLTAPESVTADPREAFALLMRTADETGLSAAQREENAWANTRFKEVSAKRSIHPEPAAPELSLNVGCFRVDGVEGAGGDRPYYKEEVGMDVDLNLPKAPHEWLGAPFDLHIDLQIVKENGGCQFHLGAASISSPWRRMELSFHWDAERSSIGRSPWKGGAEDRALEPAELAYLRPLVDDFFEKLSARGR